MEIPHAEHNSRNSVRRLTCSKLKCYTTLIRRETWVPQKEVTHQKLSQVSPLMSYICLVLSRLHWPLKLFSDVKDPMIVTEKRGLHLPMDEKKNWSRFRVASSHKTNARREYKCLQTIGQLILFILPRNEELPQEIQIKHTETLN